MDDYRSEENDEYMDYFRQFRPQIDRAESCRKRVPRSVYSDGYLEQPVSDSGTTASLSSSVRDSNMALPRHKKLLIKSKSIGRDPRFVDLHNTYRRFDHEDSSTASYPSSSYMGVSESSEQRFGDTVSRDSGNSSAGTPEFGHRGIIRHNSYPSPFSGNRLEEDSVSLLSARAPQEYDSLSLRSLGSTLQSWSPLSAEIRPRLSAKRKFEAFSEEDGGETSVPKRPRSPILEMEDSKPGLCGVVMRRLVKFLVLTAGLVVLLISGLFAYEIVRAYQCNVKSRLLVDSEGLSKKMQENLYGQHIAQQEVTQAIASFLGQTTSEESSSSAKPLLVMLLAGWMGSGKTFTSSIISSSFPVKGNIHKIVGSFLSTSLTDLPRIISRSCGYNLIIVDDMETGGAGGLVELERLLISLSTDEETQSNGTLVVLSTNTGGHHINRFMLEKAKVGLDQLELVDGDQIRRHLKDEKVVLPIHNFLSEYNIPSVVIPYLPLTREHIRSCIKSELRSSGATMTGQEINNILDHVQFFSKELPIFAKTGCKKISSKVVMALGGHLDL